MSMVTVFSADVGLVHFTLLLNPFILTVARRPLRQYYHLLLRLDITTLFLSSDSSLVLS
jgi:hypothetical protein